MNKPIPPTPPQRVTTAKDDRRIDISDETLRNVIDIVTAEGVTDLSMVDICARDYYDEDRTVEARWTQVIVTTLDDAQWTATQSQYAAAKAQYDADLAAYERHVADEQRRADLYLLNKLCARYPDAVNKIANA